MKQYTTSDYSNPVVAFYAAWETQPYTEVETKHNGCYALCTIEGVQYMDSELYGHLNSVDNTAAVRLIIEDKYTFGSPESCLSYTRHARD